MHQQTWWVYISREIASAITGTEEVKCNRASATSFNIQRFLPFINIETYLLIISWILTAWSFRILIVARDTVKVCRRISTYRKWMLPLPSEPKLLPKRPFLPYKTAWCHSPSQAESLRGCVQIKHSSLSHWREAQLLTVIKKCPRPPLRGAAR
jgi:hypothetical protein